MKDNPKLDAIAKRPMKHLAYFTSHYPHIWREHDRLRAVSIKYRKWPQWCYGPSRIAGRYLYPEHKEVPTSGMGLMFSVSTLAAWRVTKGIYLFDETVFESLWETAIEGQLPVELLHRLPEWCVYIPFPATRMLDWSFVELQTELGADERRVACYGFFGHLDWAADGTTWLHLTLDTDCHDDPRHEQISSFALNPLTLKLVGNLSESCAPFYSLVEGAIKGVEHLVAKEQIATFRTAGEAWAHRQEQELIRPMVSILLWLCSAKPEISGLDPLRGLRTKKTKEGVRHFNAQETRVYEVAYRIGAALRLAQEAVTRGKPGDGTHASPRPHIRKAHWHAFWTGPRASVGKDQPTERKLILKWVAPIAVCVGTDDTIIPTIHPVIVGRELEERQA